MQPLELGDDLAVKLGVRETYNDQLNRPDGHGERPFTRVFAGLTSDARTRLRPSFKVDPSVQPPSPEHKRGRTTVWVVWRRDFIRCG
jgi:hypothetical protein